MSLITSDLLQARAKGWKERKNEQEDERVEGREEGTEREEGKRRKTEKGRKKERRK